MLTTDGVPSRKAYRPIFKLIWKRWNKDESSLVPSLDLIMLGIALMAVQVWDALLTARGVYHFGIVAEGNFLLRFMMGEIGYINALLVAKSLAIVVIVLLIGLAHRIVWLPHALRAIVVVYICAAIIPWSIILVDVI